MLRRPISDRKRVDVLGVSVEGVLIVESSSTAYGRGRECHFIVAELCRFCKDRVGGEWLDRARGDLVNYLASRLNTVRIPCGSRTAIVIPRFRH